MRVRPAALIEQNGAVLTMRYRYGEEDVYVLPGGNPDPGEALPQALEREIREELGVGIVVGEMILAGEVLRFNAKEDTLHCVFRATIPDGETPALDSMHTTAQSVEWVPCEKLGNIALYPNFGPYLSEAPLPGSFRYTGPLRQVYRS